MLEVNIPVLSTASLMNYVDGSVDEFSHGSSLPIEKQHHYGS